MFSFLRKIIFSGQGLNSWYFPGHVAGLQEFPGYLRMELGSFKFQVIPGFPGRVGTLDMFACVQAGECTFGK